MFMYIRCKIFRLAKNMRDLSNEHAALVSVSRQINELFAVQNILSVLLIFLQLTYATFK